MTEKDKNKSVFYKCGLEISKACTNNSTAKCMYSFSKAPRFPGDKVKTKEEIQKEKEEEKKRREEEKTLEKNGKYIKHDYYALPSTLNKRYTKFGYGERTDFTGGTKKKNLSQSVNVNENKENKILSPQEKLKQLYTFAEYEYEKKYYHGVKYSIPNFGKDKEKKEKEKEEKEEKEKEERKKKVVITERPEKAFGAEAPYFTIKGIPDEKISEMRAKIKEKIKELEEEKEKNRRKQIPPHEEKITIQIKQSGKYPLSYIPNVNSVKIEKPDKYKEEIKKKLEKNEKDDYIVEKEKKIEELREKLEKENAKKDVEPVEPKELKKYIHSLMGTNFPSKYRTNEGISITERHQIKDSRDNNPGPGSYIIPSEFGVFYPKNYPEENVYPVEKKEFEPRAWRHNMKKIKPVKEEAEEQYNQDNQDNQDNQENQDNQDNQENQEENKMEEVTPTPMQDNDEKNEKKDEKKDENEENKEEDKESECIFLRDILIYKDEA